MLLAPKALKPIIIHNIARLYRKSLLSLTHLKLLGSMLWECGKTKRVLYSLPHSSAVCSSSPLGTKTLIMLRTAPHKSPTALRKRHSQCHLRTYLLRSYIRLHILRNV